MIDFAKVQGRYGMAIYYELLLGDEYVKMDDYGIAEGIFIAAYEEAKKYRPIKHRNNGRRLPDVRGAAKNISLTRLTGLDIFTCRLAT